MDAGGAIASLADIAGIAPRYWDIHGTLHETSTDTLARLLCALGYAASSEGEAADSLNRIAERDATQLAPPVAVIGETGSLALRAVPDGTPVRWSIRLETGESFDGESAPTHTGRLALPSLPLGYHDLAFDGGGHTRLIVTPGRCFLPEALIHGRGLGVATQLYALRRENDFGIGDFGHLRTLIDALAGLGGDAIGLNPLHALFLDTPIDASPYSPSSRLFKNPLYIDIEAVPDFASSDEARAMLQTQAGALATLRAKELIDYPEVAKIKLALLEACFRSFCQQEPGSRYQEFRHFVGQGGRDLEDFAAFQAYAEHFATHDWGFWPEGCRCPDAADAGDMRKRYGGRIAFFQYLQFLCEEQLAAASQRAKARGMAVGLYNDLAISVNGASADHWSHQDLFAGQLRIGAPPDPFNQAGQEWGVVPMKPSYLRETGYAHFIALLRANMRHAGALRIDHVMGWQRLFLIPAGEKPAAGAYVRYPLEDLVGIAALESHRHRCLLIGEDLGTVPEGFREKMAAADILSCRIFYFERENGQFKPPKTYPPLAAVSVSTHDLATLRGYLTGEDIVTKVKAGMLDEAGEVEARRQRGAEKCQMLWALMDAGLLPEGIDPNDPALTWTEALSQALQVHLSRGPSKLFLAQIDDLLAVAHQANLPGSTHEYPNWSRRHPRTLEAAFADPAVQQTVRDIAAARR